MGHVRAGKLVPIYYTIRQKKPADLRNRSYDLSISLKEYRSENSESRLGKAQFGL